MEKQSVKDAINAILTVLNIHENHLYPRDKAAFELAVSRLTKMREHGFK